MSAETAVREVLSKVDSAWREKNFDGLEQCFHEHAVIVGPGYVEYAVGRSKCAESYREFATNADILNYSEEAHSLRIWDTVAVYTFRWRMMYRRKAGQNKSTALISLCCSRDQRGGKLLGGTSTSNQATMRPNSAINADGKYVRAFGARVFAAGYGER